MVFASASDAKRAKKALHKQSFYGFPLAFRYQPERESVEDTLEKLDSRAAEVSASATRAQKKQPRKTEEPAKLILPEKRRRI